jgi:hypothetical protein
MRLYLLLAAGLLALVSPCAPRSSPPQTAAPREHVLSVKENRKYKVRCVFYGEEMEVGANLKAKVVRYVAVRNEGGDEARYAPLDAAAGDSDIYFDDVWSPDEEYLVLPRGRSEGFCIVKARGAFEGVKARRCDDFIKVRETNGTALWHEFVGWDGESLTFKAGLSGDSFTFAYDLPRRSLTTAERPAPSVEGENSGGKLQGPFISTP